MRAKDAPKSPTFYERVYLVVERIPAGTVATYGQVAALAGCTARQAGYALSSLPLGAPIPWQRVINSKGKISMRGRGDGQITQRTLLEKEGVVFRANGSVDLDIYRWTP